VKKLENWNRWSGYFPFLVNFLIFHSQAAQQLSNGVGIGKLHAKFKPAFDVAMNS